MIELSVEVKNLIKVYKIGQIEIQALRGLDLRVEKGEMVSLIGPSGSGKTTLLNILGGLDYATAGHVEVLGKDLTLLDPSELVNFRRGNVGHVFQSMNLIPTLTAAENVELPMAALGKSQENRRERVEEILHIVGLSDRMDHKPDELSGGEKQRVALAAALANDPPLILADEPTGELDTDTARVVANYLSKVNKDLGKTIVMVTHDPNMAKAGNRILRIQDGTISTEVTPSLTSEDGEVTYADTLRARINEIDSQLSSLENMFRNGEITGENYVAKQSNLTKTKQVLREELQRIGIVH